MYHFVKIDRTWYLKPESEQDIIDHYNIILRREFVDGFNDRKESTHVYKGSNGKPEVYIAHPITPWAKAIECYQALYNLSWVETANKLEELTMKDRFDMFRRGKKMYLRDGLTIGVFRDDPIYVDETWSEELIYPDPEKYTIEDIRYIQWKDGSHWYAKIGKYDVVDDAGNQKWDKKIDAINVAKIFLKQLNG